MLSYGIFVCHAVAYSIASHYRCQQSVSGLCDDTGAGRGEPAVPGEDIIKEAKVFSSSCSCLHKQLPPLPPPAHLNLPLRRASVWAHT